MWHLLQRVPRADRPAAARQLRTLVPGEMPATEEALVDLDAAALEASLAYLVGATM